VVRGILVAVVALGLLVPAGPAFALECGLSPLPLREVTVHPNGEAEAPVDSLIWVVVTNQYRFTGEADLFQVDLIGPVETVRLVDPAATPVLTGRMFAFTPPDLLPETDYTVRVAPVEAPREEAPEEWPHESTFRTGSDPAGPPPDLPFEQSRTAHSDPYSGGACGSPYYDWIRFNVGGGGYFHLLGADADHGLDGPEVGPLEGGTIDTSTTGRLEINGDGPGHRVGVAFGAMDLAGGFSGWSETTTATYAPAGCTCTDDGRGSCVLLVVLGPGLLGAGRRRRP